MELGEHYELEVAVRMKTSQVGQIRPDLPGSFLNAPVAAAPAGARICDDVGDDEDPVGLDLPVVRTEELLL